MRGKRRGEKKREKAVLNFSSSEEKRTNGFYAVLTAAMKGGKEGDHRVSFSLYQRQRGRGGGKKNRRKRPAS